MGKVWEIFVVKKLYFMFYTSGGLGLHIFNFLDYCWTWI